MLTLLLSNILLLMKDLSHACLIFSIACYCNQIAFLCYAVLLLIVLLLNSILTLCYTAPSIISTIAQLTCLYFSFFFFFVLCPSSTISCLQFMCGEEKIMEWYRPFEMWIFGIKFYFHCMQGQTKGQ